MGLGAASLKLKPPVGESVSGTGGGFDFAIGGTLGAGFVLAADIAANSFTKSIGPFEATYTFAAFSLLGDWYFDPKAGLHAQLGIGTAAADAKVSGASSSSGIGNGGVFTLGIGYDGFVSDEWSLGGLLRYQQATLKRDGVETANTSNIGMYFVGTYH